jgi:hypothetical protein
MDYDNDEDGTDNNERELLKFQFFQNMMKDPVGVSFVYGLLSYSNVIGHYELCDTERKQCFNEGKRFIGSLLLNDLKQYAPKELYNLLISGNIVPILNNTSE